MNITFIHLNVVRYFQMLIKRKINTGQTKKENKTNNKF